MPFLNGYGPDPAVVIQNLYSQDLPSEDAPMTTDDLIAFLRARLDEDEQLAHETAEESGGSTWAIRSTDVVLADDRDCYVSGFANNEIRDHIARHDPARVLRDVEAKRRIVDEIAPLIDRMDEAIEAEWGSGFGPIGESDKLLTLLALPYANHPDYRQDWRL